MKYLVVGCTEVEDNYGYDIYREPICVCDDFTKYNYHGYEIYQINDDGSLKLIRKSDDVTNKSVCIVIYNDPSEEVLEVIKLHDGEEITINDIKQFKKKFHIGDSIHEIKEGIEEENEYGYEATGHWVVLGIAYDDIYPTGY